MSQALNLPHKDIWYTYLNMYSQSVYCKYHFMVGGPWTLVIYDCGVGLGKPIVIVSDWSDYYTSNQEQDVGTTFSVGYFLLKLLLDSFSYVVNNFKYVFLYPGVITR